jgi:hypothetical protein
MGRQANNNIDVSQLDVSVDRTWDVRRSEHAARIGWRVQLAKTSRSSRLDGEIVVASGMKVLWHRASESINRQIME